MSAHCIAQGPMQPWALEKKEVMSSEVWFGEMKRAEPQRQRQKQRQTETDRDRDRQRQTERERQTDTHYRPVVESGG